MRLGTTRVQGATILGPCPGCTLWTLQYDQETATSYYEIRTEEISEFGSSEPVDVMSWVDPQPWAEAVEGVLQEHWDECAALRSLFE